MKRPEPPAFKIVVGLAICYFGSHLVYERAAITLNGTVKSVSIECEQPYNNRCVSSYEITTTDGKTESYVALADDYSLHRMNISQQVIKQRWQLAYLIDGKQVSDFSLRTFWLLIIVGLALITWGIKGLVSATRAQPGVQADVS